MSGKRRSRITGNNMPGRDEVLAYLADNPGAGGKREIARHFGLKGADKIGLKSLLRELEHEGLIESRGKRLMRGGDLPPVTVILVTERDTDGELIAVPAEWDRESYGEPPRVLLEQHSSRRLSGRQPGLNDRVLARLRPAEAGAVNDDIEGFSYLARPIKVLEVRKTRILGVARRIGDRAILIPIDRKQRELDLEQTSLDGVENDDLVAVELLSSGRHSASRGPSRGRVVERIGSMKSEHAISMIALLDHGIPHEFPEGVISEAENAQEVSPGEREDWRDIPFITIDPADAKDHDDAVYAQSDTDPSNPDGHVVLVAIADVSAYVTPGSALNREAQKRGNSVYFPDRVVPMLPERISNNLCSLREGELRPAMAVRMVFGADGQKTGHSFRRVLIRSVAKLAYEDAQAAIDGNPCDVPQTLVERVLVPLFAAYRAVLGARDVREPLDLDLPEKKIRLNEDGTVQSVIVPPRLDAHKLIEEFMIQANVAAAETLERHKLPLVYRIHDAPSREKLVSLKEFLSTINLTGPGVGAVKPARFNQIIRKVKDTENAELVNEVILRSQAQAEYATQNIGHFGLNLRRYAHFTSPIRRYSDLLVHRSLITALKLGNDGMTPGLEAKLETIAGEISATERRAMAAERDTIDRLVAHFLADQVGARFAGKITGVVKSGLFVRLSESGADGYVPAATLGQDFYRFDEIGRRLIGDETGESYRLGDLVEVRIAEAEPLAGALRFEMLSPGRKSKPIGRNRGQSRGRVTSKPTNRSARGSRASRRR